MANGLDGPDGRDGTAHCRRLVTRRQTAPFLFSVLQSDLAGAPAVAGRLLRRSPRRRLGIRGFFAVAVLFLAWAAWLCRRLRLAVRADYTSHAGKNCSGP